MMGVFEGCYTLQNYPMVGDWIGEIFVALKCGLVIGGGMKLMSLWSNMECEQGC